MKMIVALIQPSRLQSVREALTQVGVERMTVCDAQGYGRQRGRAEVVRGREQTTKLLRKVALEITVNDDFFERTVEAIQEAARTGPEGTIGDGKILVLPVHETIQIGGETRGPEAV